MRLLDFSVPMLFDWRVLQRIAKVELFACLYSNNRALEQRIDDEGCGAVICTARLEVDDRFRDTFMEIRS